jgi:hypothetical protein
MAKIGSGGILRNPERQKDRGHSKEDRKLPDIIISIFYFLIQEKVVHHEPKTFRLQGHGKDICVPMVEMKTGTRQGRNF